MLRTRSSRQLLALLQQIGADAYPSPKESKLGFVIAKDNPAETIRVAIVDDDPLICQAMSLILTDYSDGAIDVVGTAHDGEAALACILRTQPDIVLMDLAMPDMDGIETTARLSELAPDVRILVLTSLSPRATVQAAVEAGAQGFVSKTDAPEDIIRRIYGVFNGEPQFNPASQRQLINDLHQHKPRTKTEEAARLLDALPERERQAVLLAADGLTNAQIADEMYISERTAKAHLASAAEKLGMSRVQMARLVERSRL